jgi:hypothetical protein
MMTRRVLGSAAADPADEVSAAAASPSVLGFSPRPPLLRVLPRRGVRARDALGAGASDAAGASAAPLSSGVLLASAPAASAGFGVSREAFSELSRAGGLARREPARVEDLEVDRRPVGLLAGSLALLAGSRAASVVAADSGAAASGRAGVSSAGRGMRAPVEVARLPFEVVEAVSDASSGCESGPGGGAPAAGLKEPVRRMRYCASASTTVRPSTRRTSVSSLRM